MAVYVDPLIDRGWRLGPSSHMWADTLDELHLMADRIGMKRAWFQGGTWVPHYDVVASRRARAVKLGAIELPQRDAVAKWRELFGPPGKKRRAS